MHVIRGLVRAWSGAWSGPGQGPGNHFTGVGRLKNSGMLRAVVRAIWVGYLVGEPWGVVHTPCGGCEASGSERLKNMPFISQRVSEPLNLGRLQSHYICIFFSFSSCFRSGAYFKHRDLVLPVYRPSRRPCWSAQCQWTAANVRESTSKSPVGDACNVHNQI